MPRPFNSGLPGGFLCGIPLYLLILTAPCAAQEVPDTLKERIENYFEALDGKFEAVAGAPAVRGTRLRAIDEYFIHALQRHQSFFALIRTNSKGVVISEVVRGAGPERSYRKIGGQRWHIYVKSKKRPYYGLLKGDNGRYYLFWGRPVLKATSHGQRFVGAVATKIDLWDCIHNFTASITEPFLIRLGNLSLYDHKWREVEDSIEKRISVPGISRISLRHEQPKPPPPPRADTVVLPAHSKEHTQALSTGRGANHAQNRFSFAKLTLIDKIVFGLMIVALALLLILIWRLFAWFGDWRRHKKVEKKENLFS
ncbi:MAG: hypothetical protein GF344_07875 [Chitinivibrionales bacterium]|nr:hypothetical protein [Chitinivibrionales bacterium]MBD3356807.1 hypothetical protein [Chitinivibrionales bacterium]